MKTRYLNAVLMVLVLALLLPQPGQTPAVAAAAAPPPAGIPLWGAPRQGPLPGEGIVSSLTVTYTRYLPLIRKDLMSCYTGQSYGGFRPNGIESLPAAQHPDKNLALRSYDQVFGYTVGLVNIGNNSQSDPLAPSLKTLFSPSRIPSFVNNYQTYNWNWDPPNVGVRGARLSPGPSCPLPDGCWEVSVAGVQTSVGETIYLPTSGYGDIAGGTYYALVLYATSSSITLKYTSEDNVVSGYTLHVDNVCVDPNLLALYNANALDRDPLPALRYHQAFGIALGTEVRIAIRDNGTFMDPRSNYDWWDH